MPHSKQPVTGMPTEVEADRVAGSEAIGVADLQAPDRALARPQTNLHGLDLHVRAHDLRPVALDRKQDDAIEGREQQHQRHRDAEHDDRQRSQDQPLDRHRTPVRSLSSSS